LDIPLATLHRIINGQTLRPKKQIVRKLSTFFDISLDELVGVKDIEWGKFNAISFYMYGSDSKTKIAFDIKDGGSEMWRFMLEDNFQGWQRIICPFSEFFARGDWQPDSADKNAVLDFPVKSFQFECLPEAKGSLYFDSVELVSTQS